ncbi:YlxR family protein [Haliangium ochraceum]
MTRGRPAPDSTQRQPGRGAYLHADAGCIDRALKRGNLGRALRIRWNPSHTTALRQSLSMLLASTTATDPERGGTRDGDPRRAARPATAVGKGTGPKELLQRMQLDTSVEVPTCGPGDISAADGVHEPRGARGSHETNGLTRPAPPIVDECQPVPRPHQGRGNVPTRGQR